MKEKYPFIYNFIKRYPLRYFRNILLKKSEFPSEIWLENTNHCNAECVMCPRESHTRDKGLMSFDLYAKLIKEVSVYRDQVKRVHMHNFGEPLLDKQLPDRIKLAKDLGIKHVYFVTNASLLDEKNSLALIASGLDEIKISFYGVGKSSYNNIMKGLDFDTTLNNIKSFFEIRKKLKVLKPKVVIQLIPQMLDDLKDKEKWIEIFRNMIDEEVGDKLNFFKLHNLGGGRDYIDTSSKTIRNVCNYPWNVMVVLQDGNVSPCCFDYNGEMVLGNVESNTIFEIWSSKKYLDLRSDFKNLNYSNYKTCMKCNVPFG